MTESENSTPDDDGESSDRSSSLRDLAESTRRRRSGERSDTAGPEVNLNTGDDAETGARFEFDTSTDLVDRDGSAVPPEIEGSSNILLLGPLRGTAPDRCCVNLLAGYATDPANVLFVTLTRPVDDRLEIWRQHTEDAPATMTILSLGDQTRNSSVEETVTMQGGPGDISIASLADPSDLTRLGISLTKQLSAMPSDGADSVLCVHSLTALLQYVDARRLFRFLHILHKKIETVGAVAHYHMDPDIHDDQTISVFKTLFETVVRTTDDGTVELISAPE